MSFIAIKNMIRGGVMSVIIWVL